MTTIRELTQICTTLTGVAASLETAPANVKAGDMACVLFTDNSRKESVALLYECVVKLEQLIPDTEIQFMSSEES